MKDRTPTRILVAVDFSPASQRALRYGADLARQSGAKLDVVHVMVPSIPLAAGPDPVAVVSMMVDERPLVKEKLKTWCEVGGEEGLVVESHLLEGEPAAAILRCAEQVGADHLVLGAHGHSRLREWLLGSVARNVQSRAFCPVTTLRALEDQD
jgi:nucleotide-binding universal stress UspA family protein